MLRDVSASTPLRDGFPTHGEKSRSLSRQVSRRRKVACRSPLCKHKTSPSKRKPREVPPFLAPSLLTPSQTYEASSLSSSSTLPYSPSYESRWKPRCLAVPTIFATTTSDRSTRTPSSSRNPHRLTDIPRRPALPTVSQRRKPTAEYHMLPGRSPRPDASGTE
jgi:hypothetical protein